MKVTPPLHSTRKNSETQKVKRRIRTLQIMANRYAKIIGDREMAKTMTDQDMNLVLMKHVAVVWALGFIERHQGLAIEEAKAIEARKVEQAVKDAGL